MVQNLAFVVFEFCSVRASSMLINAKIWISGLSSIAETILSTVYVVYMSAFLATQQAGLSTFRQLVVSLCPVMLSLMRTFFPLWLILKVMFLEVFYINLLVILLFDPLKT